MDAPEPQFLDVGTGRKHRRIAYRLSSGDEPALLWLPGFLSDMASTKATAAAAWAAEQSLAMMRFDYSAHGLSGGDLTQAVIGDWVEESIAVWELMGRGPRIVIGSSMGGWIALLLARHLARQGRSHELAGLVLIAPAFDMTEALMWRELPQAAKDEIETKGATYVPSAYGAPYPITKHLIEEGRSHLLGGHSFDPGCPVRILQGVRDPDVPWRHALALVDLLTCAEVELTLIKDGDHRLSEPQDLQRLTAAIAALAARGSRRRR
jgi:pimeloyl-ACP methyl ester carboxylesterase